MKYIISDFRNLVSMWCNEFLPEAASDKSMFLQESDIIYIPQIHLDESLKRNSMKFILKKSFELMGNDENKLIIVREPKPISNVRIKPFLMKIEDSTSINPKNKEKIFHLANHRYEIMSEEVVISQWKDIDIFLNQTFELLSKIKKPSNIKFYSSESLGFQDSVETFNSFFPRESISYTETHLESPIEVKSNSDILNSISSRIGYAIPNHQTYEKFIIQAKKSMISDMEEFV